MRRASSRAPLWKLGVFDGSQEKCGLGFRDIFNRGLDHNHAVASRLEFRVSGSQSGTVIGHIGRFSVDSRLNFEVLVFFGLVLGFDVPIFGFAVWQVLSAVAQGLGFRTQVGMVMLTRRVWITGA